jgi:hypothetical protein
MTMTNKEDSIMPSPPDSPVDPNSITVEASGYLRGLFTEFTQQVHRYAALTDQLVQLEARIELTEKMVVLTRDHLAMTIEQTDSAAPHDWNATLKRVQFVGCRLVDACLTLLREHKKLAPSEILLKLNLSMFRFRSNAPLREIHAALLRQPSVKRTDDAWVWVGEQTTMPLHVVKRSNDNQAEEPDDAELQSVEPKEEEEVIPL